MTSGLFALPAGAATKAAVTKAAATTCSDPSGTVKVGLSYFGGVESNLNDIGATVCFTAPTFYRQMAPIAKSLGVPSLRKSVSAGEGLPDAVLACLRHAEGAHEQSHHRGRKLLCLH